MVKLGSNLSDKIERQQSADDGFDNIPLITPLEVSQLQQTFADKVIVKTSVQQQLQQQKKRRRNWLYTPNIRKLSIHLYTDVSDKVKIAGLIFITLGFLTGLLLLLMHKAMWYDQLTCPDGFVLQQTHCTPAALEMFYTDQQQQQEEEPGARSSSSSSSSMGLYAALSQIREVRRSEFMQPSAFPIPGAPEMSRRGVERSEAAKAEE